MLFDPGNLITLAIVAIILAVYRFLDRDNRSLEKVKKFTDRIREDLSAYVDQRSEDLKSYGIELDVRSKAAKEILKRVKEAQDELESRSETLDSMGSRLTEYDGVLARLADMTARVDENLKRIHEESLFADQLARKLKDSEEALARIDAEVPVLRERFAEDARKALQDAREGLVAEARDRLDATVEEVEALREETEQRREQVAAFYRDANEQAKARYVELEKLLAAAFRKAQDEAERLEDSTYEKFREQIETRGERLKETLDGKLKTIQEAAKEKVLETQGLVKGFKAEWQKEARDLLEASRSEIAGQAETLASRIDELETRAEKAEGLAAARFDKIEARALELAQALQAKVKDQLKAHQDELTARQAELRAELAKYDASGKEMEKEIRAVLAGIHEKMVREAAALEKKTFEDFSRRVEEYRAEVDYKFERLSESNVDIQRMEETLRSAMAGTERRVEEDFALFGKDLAARQAAFEAEILAEASRVRGNMEAVEKEINALKASAYQSVSEKLKVFEDEFFADLKTRGEAIEEHLGRWQGDLEAKLAGLSEEARTANREAAKETAEELRTALGALQASLFEQMEKLSAQTQAFRDGVTDQMEAADGSLASLRESVRAELAEAKAAADAVVRTELERFQVDGRERIKEAARDLETRLRALSESADAASQEGKEFREALARDTQAAQAEAARFRQELTQKIAQALEGFGRSYEAMSADSQRRSRELAAAMDQALQAFQRSAEDYAGRMETDGKRLAERYERESAERARILADIDARVKAFAAQTKLFERADELQNNLRTTIETLKGDLARLEARKGEIAELETQFQRIKRLEDETDQKVSRFLAEKRRIDTLEEDFKRLLGLSQEVDRKLASVTESRDSLTDLQAEFRRLSGLADEAGTKFERLEKKSSLLDTTADGVDKSFEALREVEQEVKDLEQRVRPLADRAAELQTALNALDKDRDRVDQAVSRLAGLDKDLEETETRIEKVQKAREWLARTETRLEELNKQAQDQLKLLGTLLKPEAGGARKEPGAPSLSAQETVRKLAHQGWKVEEIARAVKLSRGEVELILELSSQ